MMTMLARAALIVPTTLLMLLTLAMPAHALTQNVKNDSSSTTVTVLNGNRGTIVIQPGQTRGVVSGPASRAVYVPHGWKIFKDGQLVWASACISGSWYKNFSYQPATVNLIRYPC